MGNYGLYGFSRGGGRNFYGFSRMEEQGSFFYDQIQGLIGWYDASQEVNYADGDAIYTLKDWGPGYINLSARNATTYRPLYKINITNGLPGILFDGTDDNYAGSIALVPDANDFTIAAVVRPTVSGTGVRYHVSGGAGSTTARVFMSTTTTGITTIAGGAGLSGDITPETFVSDTPFLHVMWGYGGNLYAQVNNGTLRSGTFSNVTTLGNLAIGAYLDGSKEYFKGYIHEILFYSPHIPDSDLTALQGSLMYKWGLS